MSDLMIDGATLARLRRAMLPMDGSIADHAETILAAAAEAIPRAKRAELTYVDLTAGSCLLPLAFAASGARRVVVNDTAARSIVAARALFHGEVLAPALVARALAGDAPMRAHIPSFHFASDYLTAGICAVFDRLFHADLPVAQAATLRYLALRYVQDFADPEDGFRILLTHDRAQLLADDETDWRRFLACLDDGPARLERIRAEIEAGQLARGAAERHVLHADMRDVAAAIRCDLPCLVAVNPPTNGVDEYVIDDQLVHSLIANRLVPLTRCKESAEAFWRSRVETALAGLPAGALYLVWGGDGAMSAEACRAVWERYGACVHAQAVQASPTRRALWGIFRRR
jgi:hypothetical protein